MKLYIQNSKVSTQKLLDLIKWIQQSAGYKINIQKSAAFLYTTMNMYMKYIYYNEICIIFPVVMYGCESWTIKKAEHQRSDAFELWC